MKDTGRKLVACLALVGILLGGCAKSAAEPRPALPAFTQRDVANYNEGYMVDLNGDGIPELCCEVDGSRHGFSATWVMVYDYANDKRYWLCDNALRNGRARDGWGGPDSYLLEIDSASGELCVVILSPPSRSAASGVPGGHKTVSLTLTMEGMEELEGWE